MTPREGSATVVFSGLLRDEALLTALHSGLPLRILVRAELWRDGIIDRQQARAEWRASVVYDPLESRYRVATGGAGATELSVDSLPGVRRVLEEACALPLRPQGVGRYYYLGEVEAETLSPSDLDELQHWLRGELAAGGGGDEEVGSALGRGIHKVVVRALGIPERRWRLRSEPFGYGSPRR